MAIAPLCDYCKSELSDFGALLFSPPDAENRAEKFHICAACFERMKPE